VLHHRELGECISVLKLAASCMAAVMCCWHLQQRSRRAQVADTSQQLLDAVAIGQLTPGPVFTATFGYLLAGNAGAIAGTIGIFLPAFLLVWFVNPLVPKLRQSSWASGFLDGVNAASLGLMAGVTYTLGQTALVD